ncbi:hypothetical protein [Marilutibacter alkalisoli]|uniref:Uncharacterized protein n=1 Tax=Marilutibacter alkalisoli TaxID=2591633 RepID=A0A514BN35_9GAMM|nr:hypothetical protein [Lysobacter alkalisoli]QDH68793.1 hypothetical protein FKV23_00695 [Lysobacter alkalisoli]
MNIRHPDPNPDPAQVREARRQAEAEQARTGTEPTDPAIDRYRAVYHAVRSAPLPEPPPTFALQMERLTRDHDERAGIEAWLMRLLPVLALAALAAWGGGAVLDGLQASLAQWRALPWPMLVAAAAGLGGAWVLDRLLQGSRPGPGGQASTGN